MPKTIAITPSWYWPANITRVAGVPPFTLEEHLDGSLWARDGAAHVRLAEAPASAPVLRTRHIRRGPAPQGDPWSPRPDHPWRGRHSDTDTTRG